MVTSRAALFAILAALALHAQAGLAAEPEEKEEPTDPNEKRLGATWVVTVGEQKVATERLKLVTKGDGASFASYANKPDAQDGVALVGVLWREADGRLNKYWRSEDKRKGVGLRAFRKADSIRIVGVNDRRTPAEMPGGKLAIFDRRVLSTLWDWLGRLETAVDRATVSFADVEQGVAGKATLLRQAPIAVGSRKGFAVQVSPWLVEGTSVAGLMLYLDQKRRLVGVKTPERAMLLAGWSWIPPAGAVARPADATGDTADEGPGTGDDDAGDTGP